LCKIATTICVRSPRQFFEDRRDAFYTIAATLFCRVGRCDFFVSLEILSRIATAASYHPLSLVGNFRLP
jgi:hypothetical protein